MKKFGAFIITLDTSFPAAKIHPQQEQSNFNKRLQNPLLSPAARGRDRSRLSEDLLQNRFL
jgi:hypothetical protein